MVLLSYCLQLVKRLKIKTFFYHNPIWMKCNVFNWGLKPFRSLNGWLDRPGFVDLVDKEWNSMVCTGSTTFVVKKKFKWLKASLRK